MTLRTPEKTPPAEMEGRSPVVAPRGGVLARAGNGIWHVFTSVRWAILFVSVLLALCAYGISLPEVDGQAFFRSRPFNAAILLIVVNLIVCTVNKYPFRWAHTGFLLVHTGLILTLCGAIVTNLYGVEGHLRLAEGETAASFFTRDREFTIELPETGFQASFPLDFDALEGPHDLGYSYSITPELRLEVGRYFPELRGDANAGNKPRNPAVEVTLEFAGDPPSRKTTWVGFGREGRLPVGDRTVGLRWGPREVPLGFELRLEDFILRAYDGSTRPASFESYVTLHDRIVDADDPTLLQEERWVTHRIYMNHPLVYNGYSFYQSSYDQDTLAASVFQVTRDPGYPMVYTGFGVLCLGVAYIFLRKKAAGLKPAEGANP